MLSKFHLSLNSEFMPLYILDHFNCLPHDIMSEFSSPLKQNEYMIVTLALSRQIPPRGSTMNAVRPPDSP